MGPTVLVRALVLVLRLRTLPVAHDHRSKAENSPITYPSVVLGLSNPLTVQSIVSVFFSNGRTLEDCSGPPFYPWISVVI